MRKVTRILILALAPLVLSLAGIGEAPAVTIDSGGAGCVSIGGLWDSGTKTCTLTSDLNEGIIIYADGITLDGNDRIVNGGGTYGFGIQLYGNGATVKNLTFVNFTEVGMLLWNSSHHTVTNNNIGFTTGSQYPIGIDLQNSDYNTFTRNTIANYYTGMYLRCSQAGCSSNNLAYNNNFINNHFQARGAGLTTTGNVFNVAKEEGGGNYWSDFDEHGEGCDDADSDGFCDSPRSLGVNWAPTGCPNNCDEFPLTTQNGWEAAPPVHENQPAVAQCQDVTATADASCQASASVDAGSFDPDGALISVDQSPPGPYNLGTNQVTLTVTDDQGASDSCIAAVTVVDDTPPILTVPSDQTVSTDSGVCTADVLLQATAADNCDAAPVVSSNAPSPFPLGTTTVTFTATASSGNPASATTNVTVMDNEAPAISCNSPATIRPPDAPISFRATGADNCAVASVVITQYDCWFINPSGRRVDKTGSCVVQISGDTVTIVDSGGVGDHINWTAFATDNGGNPASVTCEVEVVNPGRGGGRGR